MAWEPNKPLVIEEIKVAPPEANEVRIKVRGQHQRFIGVCTCVPCVERVFFLTVFIGGGGL